jgi:hypothetical protein
MCLCAEILMERQRNLRGQLFRPMWKARALMDQVMKAEVYIQIGPLNQPDHKRITRNKNSPLQRIKVSSCAQLSTIAQYVRQQAGLEADGIVINLYVPYHISDTVRLPLTMSVAELIAITNQEQEANMLYSFAEAPSRSVTVPVPQVPLPSARPKPDPTQCSYCWPFTSTGDDWSFQFSNSFGGRPLSMGLASHGGMFAQVTDTDDQISLKTHLEPEIERI